MCYTRRIRRHVQHQENIVQFLKNLIPVVTRVLVSFLEFKSSSLHVLYMFRTEENKKMKPSQGKIRISLKVPNFFFFGEPVGLALHLITIVHVCCSVSLKKKKIIIIFGLSQSFQLGFFFKNTKYFNTYTREERKMFFKETYRGVYPKWPNS